MTDIPEKMKKVELFVDKNDYLRARKEGGKGHIFYVKTWNATSLTNEPVYLSFSSTPSH